MWVTEQRGLVSSRCTTWRVREAWLMSSSIKEVLCNILQMVIHSSLQKNKELDTCEKLWEVKQVLADLLLGGSSVVQVFAAQIQPKTARFLIRKLNLCAPLLSLNHVKRIRRKLNEDEAELSIILCTAPSGSVEWSASEAPLDVCAIVEEHGLIPFVATVPQHEACSREEWEEQCCLWPTSYHPNAIKLHQAVSFEKNEIEDICKHMRVAISQAQLAAKAGQPSNGAVIVDPTTGVVISLGHDESGGWMFAPCALDPEQKLSKGGNTVCINVENQSSNEKVHSWHPLRHAVMVAIERAAERNKAEKDGYDEGLTKQPRTIESIEEVERPSHVPGDQYLCTGFDAYITREPCSMCAMALLHQRVRRVFYGVSNSKVGALGGCHKLHEMSGLNHRYLVFQVLLSEEDIVK
ncbi:hypothetical protein L7F22_051573 [Adiantum nelumboides]|nr:hypothetical protein [Adiantum nelumboides]